MSIAQDTIEVKQDVCTPMSEPCPNCGISGRISVGGIGKNVTAKCGLCSYQWNPIESEVKSWQEMSPLERWSLDPHRAGREDAAAMRARYGRMGRQANYGLFANATYFLEAAEFFMDGGHLRLARYYLDLVKERISMLEARIEDD